MSFVIAIIMHITDRTICRDVIRSGTAVARTDDCIPLPPDLIYSFVSNRVLGHIISAIHAINCAEGIKINCARIVPNNLAITM